MNDAIYQNLKFYFPFVVEKMLSYKKIGRSEHFIKLIDGSTVLYNELLKTIRNIPNDLGNCTEERFRKQFGIRIREVLFDKGISQKDLSSITGIHEVAMSKYINGKVTPSVYNANKIAKALGCTIDQLIYIDK